MVKLRDIAKETGLNVSTVSRALRDASDIKPETIKRVKKTALQMGYRIRPRNRKSKTVGLIIPEVKSHYYSEMMETVNWALKKYGYSMIVSIGGFNVSGILDAYDEICKHDICGLIVNDCFRIDDEDDIQRHDRIAHSIFPLVLISENEARLPVDTICIDNKIAMRRAIEHLVELGHQNIGYIGEYHSDVRYLFYRDCLKEFGLPINENFIKRGSERFELGGYLRAKELLSEPDASNVTAVIACYDQVALGALNAFLEADIQVPEDVYIIGFDNIILNDFLPVQISSISSPIEQMSNLAVKLLIENIKNPERHVVQNISLQPRLVVRDAPCSSK